MTSVPVYPVKDVALLQPILGGTYVQPPVGGFPIQVVDPANDSQVVVDTALLPGVPGQRGPRGPQGPTGAANSGAFQYSQLGPATVWHITHNLNYNPQVTLKDSAGTTIEGDVQYNSSNDLQVTLSSAISGTAYLS